MIIFFVVLIFFNLDLCAAEIPVKSIDTIDTIDDISIYFTYIIDELAKNSYNQWSSKNLAEVDSYIFETLNANASDISSVSTMHIYSPRESPRSAQRSTYAIDLIGDPNEVLAAWMTIYERYQRIIDETKTRWIASCVSAYHPFHRPKGDWSFWVKESAIACEDILINDLAKKMRVHKYVICDDNFLYDDEREQRIIYLWLRNDKINLIKKKFKCTLDDVNSSSEI